MSASKAAARQPLRLCIATGTRAEYGLLSKLMRLAKADKAIELQIVATGTHLSKKFGMTAREIESDGFEIDVRIPLPLSDDSPSGTAKSAAAALAGFGKAFAKLKPDFLVILGDRYEMLSAAEAALFARIPIAHISGGERTDGAYDDAIRHAISKMSYLHFVAAEEYRRRVVQLGENPERVFNVGAMAVDAISSVKLMTQRQLEASLGVKLAKRNCLVTFHPATADGSDAAAQFKELLKALDSLQDFLFIFTMPNADTGGRALFPLIESYAKHNPGKAAAFASLGHARYLSVMKLADAVVGNSSSGIVEAPSFGVGTINIGSRQQGRIRAKSVIDCPAEAEAIEAAFRKLLSKKFQNSLAKLESPFGKPGASRRILNEIKKAHECGVSLKSFCDLA